MFDQTFVGTHASMRRQWTIAASLAMQAGVTAVLLMVPLLHPELLHLDTLQRKLEIPVWVPRKPPAKELPPLAGVTPLKKSLPLPRSFLFPAPVRVPRTISMEVDSLQFPGPAFTGLISPSGASSGIPGLPDALPGYTASPPSTLVVKKVEVVKAPTHVSSGVQSAKLIFGPKPLYPALAKAARLQGTVKIQAIIAPDGIIQHLNVMSGPALLIPVALEAVKQWRYQPTLLNGEAVEVATEIDVNFTLNQ